MSYLQKHNLMKRFKKIIIFVLISIVSIVIIELVSRVIYSKLGNNYGKLNLELAIKSAENEIDSSEVREMSHPYMLYVNTPNYKKDGVKMHNNNGYRNSTDFEIKQDTGVFRILVLGGSTTYGAEIVSPADVWCELLQNLLDSSYSNYKIQVINGGLNGASSADLLSHYMYRDRYLKPDLVILHTGINDANSLLFNDYSPELTHWRRGWVAKNKIGLRPAELWMVKHSFVLKIIYARIFGNQDYALPFITKETLQNSSLSAEDALTNANNNTPLAFSRNIDLLVRNISLDGATTVFFRVTPNAEFLENPQKYENTIVYENAGKHGIINQMAALQIALGKVNTAIDSIALVYDVEVLTLNETIGFNEYVDMCHLNAHGQKTKAKLFCSVLEPVLDTLLK